MAINQNTIGGSATSTTTPLPVANTIDPANDLIPIYTANVQATQAISRQTYLNLTGSPVGTSDTQTLTNKTLGNTNALTLKDSSFTLQNASDTTKQAKFSLASISTGTTRTYTLPDITDTIVTLTATQTLTNKTLTSPTINSPTITNATISADVVSGYTASTNGTIYGISVSSGVITTSGSVNGAALVNSTVTPSKLNLSPGSNYTNISTATTTSTSYTSTLSGGTAPSTTVTVGANGLVLLIMSAGLFNSGSNSTLVAYAASGANTISAADANGVLQTTGTNQAELSYVKLLTGLTAGSTTFTMNFKVGGGTGTYFRTAMTAIPL